ncbi:hypothetical protein Dimus_023180 [Dionaea muscipula]
MQIEEEWLTEICQDQDLEIEEHLDIISEPKVGMWFDSEVDALKYFNDYGKMCGFDCKIKSSKKNDDGVKTFVTISCSRARKANSSASNPLNLLPTTRTDCKAAIHISLKFGKWSINSVKLNHNHEMDLVAVKCSKAKSDKMEAILKSVVEESDRWDEECQNNTHKSVVRNDGVVGDSSSGTRRGPSMTKRKQSVFEQKSKKKAKANNKVQLHNDNENNV